MFINLNRDITNMAFRGLPTRTIHGEFQNAQDYNYNTVYPYGLPLPPNSGIDKLLRNQMNDSVKTADPFLKKMYDNPVQNAFDNLFYPTQLSEIISKSAQECRTADLDNLILNQDNNRNIRCGWLYIPASNSKIPNPRLSQGHLGIRNGPFTFVEPKPEENAEWFWNLEEAREKILTARCSAMTNCESVGGDNFKSCGYCTGIGQGVPVNDKGESLYPRNPRLNCSNGKIIMNTAQCPKEIQGQPIIGEDGKPVIGPDGQPVIAQPIIGPDGLTIDGKVPDICALRDGKFSKECILDIISSGGCQEGGSIYKAVEQSLNNDDYIDSLRSSTAFRLYNERNSNKLFMNFNTSSRAELEIEIQNLAATADNPKYTRESALGASSRDLCLRQGDINAWDPCLEIPSNARPPFDLNCLQRNFRKLGGQPAGKKYPTQILKIELYDRMPTYGDVQNYWSQILEKTRSNVYSVQNTAMIDLYGISLRPAKPIASSVKFIVGFGDVGDVKFRGIPFGLNDDILYINNDVLNNSTNKESMVLLTSDLLVQNINRGTKYSGRVANSAGKEGEFNILNASFLYYNFAKVVEFKTDKNIKKELDNPKRISVTIF